MLAGGRPHHLPLGRRPGPWAVSQRISSHCASDGSCRFSGRASTARTIRQQQFGPAPPRFLLLAGQPVPQGGNEVVVGELVVFLARLAPEDVDSSLLAFRVGRRDEADFAVENAEQVVEVLADGWRSPTLPATPAATACGP